MNPFALILLDLALAGGAIPLIFERVPRNKAYGFRFPVALQNNENWFRVNRVGGFCAIAASFLSIVWLLALWASGVENPFLVILAFILPLALAFLAVRDYSRRLP